MSIIKPILFNTEMVLATLENRKTQTRRLVSPTPPADARLVMSPDPDNRYAWDESRELPDLGPHDRRIYYPRYYPGDILYVRETWGDYRECQDDGEGHYYLYRADYPNGATTYQYPGGPVCDLPKWHPSIHMPKEAARIFLRVTDVRVERLQDIDGAGIKAEGTSGRFGATRGAFMYLWDSTVKKTERYKYSYRHNPWVWVYSFEHCEKPEEWK